MNTLIKQDHVTSIDDIEFELIDQGLMIESNNNQYVNNKELYKELKEYHAYKMECLAKGEDIPPLTNKIGVAIMQIAERRCGSRMYKGYTNNWKEEMISNAVVHATLRGHNFDPEKSDNPFAYFTQICDNAIKEQLKREKKQLYIRYKSIDNARGHMSTDDENDNDENMIDSTELDIAYEDRLHFINQYEERNLRGKVADSIEQSNETLGIFRLLDPDYEDEFEHDDE